jgi:hypothetical protein
MEDARAGSGVKGSQDQILSSRRREHAVSSNEGCRLSAFYQQNAGCLAQIWSSWPTRSLALMNVTAATHRLEPHVHG